MKPSLPRAAAAAIVLGLTLGGCGLGPVIPDPALPSSAPQSGIATFTPSPSPRSAQPRGASHSPLPGGSLLIVHDPGQVTGTLTGPCHMTGASPDQLPDHACTPGAIDTTITAARLCSGSYSTRSYRPPSYQTSRFKYEIAYPAYGLAPGTATELDHLVSLELGGANDAANLWPEPPPTPNPKDKVENALHDWVCAVSGRASGTRLRQAQLAIAGNWVTAEKVLGLPSGSSSSYVYRSSAAPQPTRGREFSSAPAAAVGCYPKTSGGNCYRAGEFCRRADLGTTGVAGNGERIRCEASGSRNRWEPA